MAESGTAVAEVAEDLADFDMEDLKKLVDLLAANVTTKKQFDRLMDLGLLADLLEANLEEGWDLEKRKRFRRVLGLPPQ